MNSILSISVFIEKFQGLTKYFSYETLKIIGIAFIIFLFFMALRKIFSKHLLNLMLKIFSKKKAELNSKIFTAFQKPLSMFFLVLGIYSSISYLRMQLLGDRYATSPFMQKLFSSSIIIIVAWGLYNLTLGSSILFDKMGEKFDLNLDKILFPFMAKIIRFLIVAFATIMVIEKWGYDIQGFIAGLGLGGLAFALAAKDAAANIFGGIVILMDKPFNIGDWIYTPSVEGVVEDISFRSTRIRTFEQGLVVVPNSTLANQPITNWNRRVKRRANFNVGITYDTPVDKIKKSVEEIRKMLKDNTWVNRESLIVNFDKFAPSSLDIFLNFYINTAELARYLEIKEDINFKIMSILEKNGVSIAFPSTSVYIEDKAKGDTKDKME
ncbi:mechanosensitive ion channel family protein [Haloimpatiens lingqiaonensis]|uniref:mechanosensitive ion channel family protein n=1 Tax=Haloimpatiens lingqiaonensis TaxID=1380675 RepID=UPI001FA9CCB4|nr:mechanosensitive ion channel family protein [Haloimpatiens lingqiaonensis]